MIEPDASLPRPLDVAAALAGVTERWTPRVVAQVNDQYVKVAKLLGELVWHAHDQEDELFWVVSGRLRIQLEDRPEVVLRSPDSSSWCRRAYGTNPVADEEVEIVLIETVTTAHTGSEQTDRTVPIERQLG